MLVEIKLLINTVETRIRCSSSELYDILFDMLHSSRFEELDFIALCVAQLDRGVPFESAWKSSLTETRRKMLLTDEELRLMESFGEELGTTDAEGQTGICEMYLELFERRLKSANEKRDRCSKLYIGLGTMAGVTVAILMI